MCFQKLLRHCRPILALLLLGSAGSYISAYVLPLGTYPKIEIDGNNTLSLNLNQIEGSSTYYSDDNFGRDRTLTNTSNLYITGELYNDLYLNANVAADPYSPDTVNWNLRYDGNDAKVLLGEFNPNMTGNEFVGLNRSLQGMKVDVVLPRGTLSLIGSNLQAPVRTDTFYGQNISGPYYLTASPIVDGSEVVTVNNTPKNRTNDYSINYLTGELSFSYGTIITPADKVTVSYEVKASGLGGGKLYAARATYPVANGLQVGASHLILDGQNEGSSFRDERDQYVGTGTRGPYDLTSRPIVPGSETVTINGVLVPTVTETSDRPYTLDYQTGRLLFAQGYEPPTGSTLIVRYRVEISSSGGGDRSVTGVDVDWALKNGMKFNAQVAQSQDDAATDVKGSNTAVTLGARYDSERLNVSTKYRSIGSGFSPLQSVGYRNVDKELQWSLNYRPSKDLSISTSGNNARLPLNPYTSSSTSDILMDELNQLFTIDYHKDSWPRLTYQRSTQDTSQVGSGSLGNTSTTDSLNLSLSGEKLSGALSFNHSTNSSRQLTDQNNPQSSIFEYSGTNDNANLNLQYQPNDRFDMGMNLAMNRIKAESSGGATTTTGSNAEVHANYQASKNLKLSAQLMANETGSAQSVTGGSINALKDQSMNVSATWKPTTNVDVNLMLTKQRTEGDLYSNSESDNITANVGWQASEKINLNGYWTRQNLKYIDSPGGSVSNMVGIHSDIGPLGKVKLSMDAQHLWGETSEAVNQMLYSSAASMRSVRVPIEAQYAQAATGNRLTTLAARISYPIAKNQEIFLTGDTSRSSGYPSKSVKNSFGLGWDYHINENLTFTLNAGRVQYRDEANEGLNYGANQLNAQLAWHF
ncbi:MAG: hypothetical protein ACYDCO_03655 [Armatimonadota bacterium]